MLGREKIMSRGRPGSEQIEQPRCSAAETVTWDIGRSSAGLDPGIDHRIRVRAALRGRVLGEVELPALAAVSPSEVDRWLVARIPHLPLRAALIALRPWTSLRFWTAAIGAMVQVAALRLKTPDLTGRGLLKAQVRRALSEWVLSRVPDTVVNRRPGEPISDHQAAFADLAAEAALPRLQCGGRPPAARGARVSTPDAGRPGLAARAPILMYHRIASDGPTALARYRVSPARFAEQMEMLARAGCIPITPQAWRAAQAANRPLPGRPVMITFDDGYADLEENAWPILQRHGFVATTFVVTDFVGGCADWDRGLGEPAPLMGWESLRRLQSDGLVIGSHGAAHRRMAEIPTQTIYQEALRSRCAIETHLGVAPTAFCYPHGSYDTVAATALAECGYTLAFSCSSGFSTLTEDPFALSRLEITDRDDGDTLAARLGLRDR
jgi:peptidoglycan/xylan/chitin deacetylase (PgdA/CDA1 family)